MRAHEAVGEEAGAEEAPELALEESRRWAPRNKPVYERRFMYVLPVEGIIFQLRAIQ